MGEEIKKLHKIIFATDIHGEEDLYRGLFEVAEQEKIDSVIIGGDILPKSGSKNHLINIQRRFIKNKLIPLIREFERKNPARIYLMMGNDDFKVNMDLLIEGEKEGYLRLLDKKVHPLIGGLNICGYGSVPPSHFLMKDWQKHDTKKTRTLSEKCLRIYTEIVNCREKNDKLEKEYYDLLSELGYTHNILLYTDRGILSVDKTEETTIEDDLMELAKKTDPEKTIFVMHCPPYNTRLDIAYSAQGHIHIGSRAVRAFIEREQPYLTLHGHVHESFELSGEFKEVIGKTVSVNPGIENAVVFDVHDIKLKQVKIRR